MKKEKVIIIGSMLDEVKRVSRMKDPKPKFRNLVEIPAFLRC